MTTPRKLTARAFLTVAVLLGVSNVQGQAITAVASVSSSTVVLPGTVSVSGTATKDPTRPGSITAAWTASGPGAVTFANPGGTSSALSTVLTYSQVSFSAPGSYSLTFTANIGPNSASDTVSVQVSSPPPLCTVSINASPGTQQVTLPGGASISANASSSSACAGPLQITWSGPATVLPSSATTTSHAATLSSNATFTAAGSFTLTATAASDGQSANATVTVDVRPAPACQLSASLAPIAQQVFLSSSASLSLSATLTGACSANSLTIAWVAAGPGTATFSNTTGPSTAVRFSATGRYTITANATGAGQTATASATVDVLPDASCSVAVTANPANQTVNPGMPATVGARAVASGCLVAPSLRWRVTPSGTISNGPQNQSGNTADSMVSIVFTQPGEYIVTASATPDGPLSSASVRVTVVDTSCVVTVQATPATQTVTLPGAASVSAAASSSSACAGPLQITWSGPPTVQIVPSSTTSTSHTAALSSNVTFTAAGSYTFTATATSDGQSASATVTVDVRPGPACQLSASIAPGSQQVLLSGSATLTALATLTGACSGSTVAIAWTAAGPGTATFSNATGPSTAARFSATGRYTITANATGAGQTGTASATVDVLPDASCSVAVTANLPNQTVNIGTPATVSARAVASGCLTPPSLQWRVTPSGTISNGPQNQSGNTADSTVSIVFTQPGEYIVTASSTPDGPLSSASVKVTVTDTSCVLTLQATPATQTVRVGEPAAIRVLASKGGTCPSPLTVNLTGTGPGSFSIDNPSLTTPANSALLTSNVTFTAPGTYMLTAAASSGTVTAPPTAITVIVKEGGPPGCAVSVRATASGPILAGRPVSITATASKTAGSGGALTVTWSVEGSAAVTIIGGGGTTTADQITVLGIAIFAEPGAYVLKASAESGACTGAEDTLRISIVPVPSQPPFVTVAVFPKSQNVKVGQSVSVTGVAARSADVAGPMTLRWSPTGADAASVGIANGSSATDGLSGILTTTATFAKAGTYALAFTAAAGSLTGADTVTVTVEPDPCGKIAISAMPGAQTILLGTSGDLTAVASKPLCLAGPLTVTWKGPDGAAFQQASASGAADLITLKAGVSFRRPGTYTLTVEASASGDVERTSVQITVEKLSVEADLPDGTVGVAYTGRLRVTNNPGGTFSASIQRGRLPDVLNLGGPADPLLISGIPVASGVQAGQKQAGCVTSGGDIVCTSYARLIDDKTNATNCIETEDCIQLDIRIRNTGTPSGPRLDRFDSPKHCAVLAGTGFSVGVGGGLEPLQWRVDGVLLDEKGRRATIPVRAGVQGPSTIGVNVTDSRGAADSATYDLNVVSLFGGDAVAIQELPDGTVGTPYLERLTPIPMDALVQGWASMDSVPLGLSLTADGVIEGVPESTGSFKATVRYKGVTLPAVCGRSLQVNVAPPLDSLEGDLPIGYLNSDYNVSLTAVGGTPPYEWSVAAGGDPGKGAPAGCPAGAVALAVAGLGFTKTGQICGKPAQIATSSPLVFEVKDSGNVRLDLDTTGPRVRAVQRTLTVRSLQFEPFPGVALPQRPYSQTVTVQGATGPLHWEAKPECADPAGRTLGIPRWLSAAPFDGPSYQLTGSAPDPADWGKTYCFTIEVTEMGGVPVKKDFELKVLACPTVKVAPGTGNCRQITATFPAAGFRVVSYSQNFTLDLAVKGTNPDPAWAIVPPSTFQLGTVAGTGSIGNAVIAYGDLQYTCTIGDAGARVSLAPAPPVVHECASITRGSTTFTTTVQGQSSTREIIGATFTVEPAPGKTLPRTVFDFSNVQDLFSQYFSQTANGRGTFTYTQQFNLKDLTPDDFSAVTVVLKNAKGDSVPKRITASSIACRVEATVQTCEE